MSDTPDTIEAVRADKLRRIEQLGIDPWGGRFDGFLPIEKIRAMPLDEANRPRVRAAGRIVLRRIAGKLHFLEIRDWSGHKIKRALKGKDRTGEEVDAWSSYVQVMIGQQQVGEQGWELAQELDLGDLLGVEGTLGVTRTGELTIFAEKLTFLGKSLQPHPDKWAGMQDEEFRLRHRYLDLIYNPDTLDRTLKRVQIVRTIRNHLDGQGFIEVETPTLHAIAGGAAARPFITHHNTLDIDLYLRIALELHLKRLLVGGIEKVYEIGRVFRNEGISRKHNPEFTMMELYQAYGDYRTMMDLTEAVIVACVDAVSPGNRKLPYGDAVIDFTPPWQRLSYGDAFRQYVGVDMNDRGRREDHRPGQGRADRNAQRAEAADWCQGPRCRRPRAVRDLRGGATCQGPVFVYDYPAGLCPLTKRKAGNPTSPSASSCTFRAWSWPTPIPS